jgi:hypothetical protein
MAGPNWHRIDKAPKGSGPLLPRAGPGPTDPAYVGYQDPDNGRWFAAAGDNTEVHPTHFCLIPQSTRTNITDRKRLRSVEAYSEGAYSSRLSFQFPQCVSLRSGLNTCST